MRKWLIYGGAALILGAGLFMSEEEDVSGVTEWTVPVKVTSLICGAYWLWDAFHPETGEE